MHYGIWTALLLTVCGAALWRGGPDERAAGAALLIAWLVSIVVDSHQGRTIQWGFLGVDSVLLVVLIIIALQSDRYWPLFAAGFHLLSVMVHVARMADRTLGAWAYISGGVLFGYLAVFALAVGTIAQWRRSLREPQAEGPRRE
jgi:hypothetical protein